MFFNLELTNNSNCKDPQEESVQHHGYIFPIFLHFVRILRPPGAINLMGTFDIVKNTLYYLVISAIYLTPSTALISSGQICPSAPWCSTFREILFSEISYLKYVTLVHQRAEGGSVVEVSVEFTTWGLKAHSIMSIMSYIRLLLSTNNRQLS